MKKFILPLSLILTTAACAPSDKEIIAKGQRDKFNQSKPGSTTAVKALKIGSFGVATFAMEKQGEILQILATINLMRNQSSGPYIVDEADDATEKFQEMILSASDYKSSTPNFTFEQNSKWSSVIKRDQDRAIVAISATSISEKGNIQKALLKGGAKLKEQAATLTEMSADLKVVRASDDLQSSDISYSAEGTLEAKIDGVVEVMPYRMRIKMRVKTDQLQSAQVEITKSEIALSLPRVNFPLEIVIKSIDGEVMTFKNDKDCPVLLGKALIATEKSKKFIVYDDVGATVVDGLNSKVLYKSAHGNCEGQRPTVNLTRLLFWN